MASDLPDVAPEMPAVLLTPSWEYWGAPDRSCLDLGQAFDASKSFTLCARVRTSGKVLAVLQKGKPPNGWTFTAPSSQGKIAFESGTREVRESETAPAEPLPVETPVIPEPAPELKPEPKAKADPKSKAKADPTRRASKEPKTGSKMPPPASAAPSPPPEQISTNDIGSTKIDDGEWHHVAVTFRAGRIYTYVDGKPDGDLGVEVNAAPAAPLLLGVEEGGGDADEATPPEGLQNVQTFATALSDAQISALATESRDLSPEVSLPLTPRQVQRFYHIHAETSADSQGSANAEASRSLLYECLSLGRDPKRSFQDEVICDFFVSLFEFAQSITLTVRKTAVFAAIMQCIFSSMFRRSKTTACVGESFSSSECFLEYKRLLLAHAATAAGVLSTVPPRRLQIFSIPEVKRLTEFVSESLFQHFFLYQCVLVSPQNETVTYTSVVIEEPLPPPALKRGKLLPPKQEAPVTSVDEEPRTSSKGEAAEGAQVDLGSTHFPDAGRIDGGDGEFDEDQVALLSQVLAGKQKNTLSGSGASTHEEMVNFLAGEAGKACHQMIESSISKRDAALKGNGQPG